MLRNSTAPILQNMPSRYCIVQLSSSFWLSGLTPTRKHSWIQIWYQLFIIEFLVVPVISVIVAQNWSFMGRSTSGFGEEDSTFLPLTKKNLRRRISFALSQASLLHLSWHLDSSQFIRILSPVLSHTFLEIHTTLPRSARHLLLKPNLLWPGVQTKQTRSFGKQFPIKFMFGANLETVSGQIVRICWLFRCFWRRTHLMLLPAFYASIWPVQWAGQELSVKVIQMPLMPLFNICSDIFPNVSAQLFSIWPHFGGLQTPVYLRVCSEMCLGKERESVRHYWQGGGRTVWGSGESRLFLEPAAAYTGSSFSSDLTIRSSPPVESSQPSSTWCTQRTKPYTWNTWWTWWAQCRWLHLASYSPEKESPYWCKKSYCPVTCNCENHSSI